jgi:asparagine synthase (glutamine-hydrolysing)
MIRSSFNSIPAEDPLGGMLAADIAVVLPDDFLVKVDRASMAHGLEVRPPLLDHEFLELAARIPSRWKVRKGESKWIFKESCGKSLPADIIRRPKQGFDMPIDAWLQGPLRGMFEESVLGSHGPVRDLISQANARRLFQSHLTGTSRHGKVLWSLLILARWAERFLQGTGSCTLSTVANGTRR